MHEESRITLLQALQAYERANAARHGAQIRG
jgi:hypothetical protein